MEDLLKRILLRVDTEGGEKIDRLIEQLRAVDQTAASAQSRFPLNMGGGSSAGATTPADALAAAYTPVSSADLQSVLSQFTGEFRGLLDALRATAQAARAGGAVPAAVGGSTPMSGGYSPNLAPDPTLPSAAPLPFAPGVPNPVPYVPSIAAGSGVAGSGGGSATSFTGGLGAGSYGNLQALLSNLQSRGDGVSMLEHRLREELEAMLQHGGMANAVLSGQGAGIPLTESGAQGIHSWLSTLNERMGALSGAQGMFSGTPGQTSAFDLQRIQELLRRSSSLGRMSRGEFALLSTYEKDAISGLGTVGGASTPFEHLETYMGRMQATTAEGAMRESAASREALRAEYESGSAAQRLAEQMDRLRQSTERYQEFLDRVSGGSVSGTYAEASRTVASQQQEERRRRNEVMQELAGLGATQESIAAAYSGVMTPEERRAYAASRATERGAAGRMFGQYQDSLGESRDALQQLRETDYAQRQEQLAKEAQARMYSGAASTLASVGLGQVVQWAGGFDIAQISGTEAALGTGGVQTAREQGLWSGLGGGFGVGGTVLGALSMLIPGAGPGMLALRAGMSLAGGVIGAGIGGYFGPNLAEAQWRAQGGPGYLQSLSQFGSLGYLTNGVSGAGLDFMRWASGELSGSEESIAGMIGTDKEGELNRYGTFSAAAANYGYGPSTRMSIMDQMARAYGYRVGMDELGGMSTDLLAWSRVTGQSPQSLVPMLEVMRRQGGTVNQTFSGLQAYGAMMGGGLDLARFGETMGLASGVSGYLQQFSSNPDITGMLGFMGGWGGLPEQQRTIVGGQYGFSNIVAPTLQTLTSRDSGFTRALMFQMANREQLAAGHGQMSLAQFADLQSNPENFPHLLSLGIEAAKRVGTRMGQGEAYGAYQMFGLSMPNARALIANDPAMRQQALTALRGSQITPEWEASLATPSAAVAAAADEISNMLKNSKDVNTALSEFVSAVQSATNSVNKATGNVGPVRGTSVGHSIATGVRTFTGAVHKALNAE